MSKIQQIIKKLNLQPHPEGGFFKETYRSKGSINSDSLAEEYGGSRNYSTAIYFLLTSDNFSSFHKIKQDEFWHFYDGSPIRLHTISPEGIHEQFIIGKDVIGGEQPQVVVPGGHWFAAEVINDNDFTLVGCTVSPGFSFEDFVLENRKNLIEKFPQHSNIITKLTNS